jgi:hypothetical protein
LRIKRKLLVEEVGKGQVLLSLTMTVVFFLNVTVR